MIDKIGKRFKTAVPDYDGDITFPPGSEFVVQGAVNGVYLAEWDGTALDEDGQEIPARGMSALWTPEDIMLNAQEVS